MVDEWSGLADLLANLIEKYASDIDVDGMPDLTSEIDIEYGNTWKENLLENDIATKITA